MDNKSQKLQLKDIETTLKKSDLTLEQLATVTNVPVCHIENFYKGRGLKPSNLDNIMIYLGYEVDNPNDITKIINSQEDFDNKIKSDLFNFIISKDDDYIFSLHNVLIHSSIINQPVEK